MEKQISVVIPIFNEEESVFELITSLTKVMKNLEVSYEVIFVDDGSTDTTLPLLKTVARKQKEVRIISFRKNFGKSYALMSGFKAARGAYIVTLDADLQDDMNSIKTLYQEIQKKDYDLVNGWRKNRKDKEVKIISSKLFNKLISLLFGLAIYDMNSGLKIYKSEVAKSLILYGGLHRFIPLLVSEMGYIVGERAVAHFPRKYGSSKYKVTKILTDIPDLITIYFLTKYTRRPLHFFGRIGSIAFIIGVIILSYLSYLWFMGESIGRRPLLFLGILLVILGIQILVTGLLADLIVNTGSEKEEQPPLRYVSE